MPDFDDEDVPRRPADELRRIARYQRWLVAVLLAELALWVGFVALSLLGGGFGDDAFRFPLILTVILGCVGGIYAFLICWTLRGPASAFVMGVGVAVPCLGLIVLTMVNGIATTALNLSGVKIGMFGADLDSIRDDAALYDDEDAGW